MYGGEPATSGVLMAKNTVREGSIGENVDKITAAVANAAQGVVVKARAIADRLVGEEPQNPSEDGHGPGGGFLYSIHGRVQDTGICIQQINAQLDRIANALGSV